MKLSYLNSHTIKVKTANYKIEDVLSELGNISDNYKTSKLSSEEYLLIFDKDIHDDIYIDDSEDIVDDLIESNFLDGIRNKDIIVYFNPKNMDGERSFLINAHFNVDDTSWECTAIDSIDDTIKNDIESSLIDLNVESKSLDDVIDFFNYYFSNSNYGVEVVDGLAEEDYFKYEDDLEWSDDAFEDYNKYSSLTAIVEKFGNDLLNSDELTPSDLPTMVGEEV